MLSPSPKISISCWSLRKSCMSIASDDNTSSMSIAVGFIRLIIMITPVIESLVCPLYGHFVSERSPLPLCKNTINVFHSTAPSSNIILN